MFVQGMPFLLGLLDPLDHIMVKYLTSRAADPIKKALQGFISKANQRNFKIPVIYADNEKGIKKLVEGIDLGEGITIENCGPGEHAKKIERAIQTVKGRFRCHRNDSPYTFCRMLVILCVAFCVSRINMVYKAASGQPIPPIEKFSGRKIDAKTDLRSPFGVYVQARVPDTDNSANPRTQGCIAGGPTGNSTGSVHMLCLSTMQYVIRDQFVILPMPDDVCRFLDAQAKRDGFKRKLDHKAGVDDDGGDTSCDDDEASSSGSEEDDITDRPRTASFMPIHGREDVQEVNVQPTQADISELLRNAASAPHSGVSEHPEPPQLPPATPLEAEPDPLADINNARGDGRANRRPLLHYNRDGSAKRTPSDQTHRLADQRREARMASALATGKESWERENWEESFVISVRQALRERPVEAEQVIAAELQQMVDKNVWRPVRANDLTGVQRGKIIRSSMFLKDKYTSAGAFEKFKARLVAGGDQQDKGEYYDKVDLSSPTAATTSVFAIAAIAANEGRRARVIDVGGAFLLADITATGILVHVRLNKLMAGILVKIDPSYEDFRADDGSVVVELDKALYGCIEAAALWYQNICSTLEQFGYVRNPYDACVFNKTDKYGVQSTIVLHVDDMMVTCVDDSIIDELEAHLRMAYPEITVRDGEVIGYLGMTFDFRVKGEVKVTMEGCVTDILAKSGVTAAKATPASECLFDVRVDSPLSSKGRQEWFHSFVAKMLYLAKRVRPECLTTVSFLAKRVQCCTVDDEAKLERLLGYVLGTRERGLVLRIGDAMSVSAYIDAAYGVHANGKSHTGCAIVLGDAALMYAKSGGQNIVTKSSTEAELVAVTDSAAQAIFMRNFVLAQGYDVGPCIIYQDNMSCMALIKRGRPGSERSRHINIRHFWVSDRVEDKEVIVRHLSTKKMFANVLTKPLQGMQFRAERNELTNWE
jgi:hypothetical protein